MCTVCFTEHLEHYITRLSYHCFIVAAILFSFRMDPDQDICMLCGKDGRQMNVAGDKSLNTIIRASTEKQGNDVHEELIRLQQSQCLMYVHCYCRRRFLDLRKRTDSLPCPKKLRSSTDAVFKWETSCFLHKTC